MRVDLDKKLVRDFPLLFSDRNSSVQETCMCWGFDCGDGWYPLIRDLASKLEPLIKHYKQTRTNYPRASQVKEKYGALCFYMSHATDKMYDLISEAEVRSQTICEECGKPGKMRGIMWLGVRCNQCYKGGIDFYG